MFVLKDFNIATYKVGYFLILAKISFYINFRAGNFTEDHSINPTAPNDKSTAKTKVTAKPNCS